MSDHKTVFISYRRSASRHLAHRIYKDLQMHGYDVFLDVNNLGNGKFDTRILHEIEVRSHFVLVLSKGSLERCANDGDWLTREMRAAINLQRNIVPILDEGFDFREEQGYLTPDLRDVIPLYNSLPLSDYYFDAAMDKLREGFLKQPFSEQVAPVAEASAVTSRVQQAAQAEPPLMTKEVYVTRGVERYKAGDYDGAISDYDEAIRLDPNYFNAYTSRGIARKTKGDLDGAIRDYDEAIRLKPASTKSYIDRGNARANKGDLDGAIRDYDEAIRIEPNLSLTYNNRGLAHADKGDFDEAIRDFNKAIRFDLKNSGAYNNRGYALFNTGDLDGAIRNFDEAIRIDPTYSIAYYNRGDALQAKGDIGGAIADYKRYLYVGGGEQYNDRAETEQLIRDLQKKR